MKFQGIKVIIWDFDGTFYRPNPELFKAVREAEYRLIMEKNGWDHARTEEEFHSLYKTKYNSATQTTAVLCRMSVADAAVEMEKYFDRRNYLARDEKLIAMFALLKQYTHYILANGVIARHKETLETLGIPWNTFVEDVTSETVGVTKPDPKGFRYIMEKTGLPAESHLMVGDREAVDLVPAKALGMKTCMVWGDSAIADASLPMVYDVPSLFL